MGRICRMWKNMLVCPCVSVGLLFINSCTLGSSGGGGGRLKEGVGEGKTGGGDEGVTLKMGAENCRISRETSYQWLNIQFEETEEKHMSITIIISGFHLQYNFIIIKG